MLHCPAQPTVKQLPTRDTSFIVRDHSPQGRRAPSVSRQGRRGPVAGDQVVTSMAAARGRGFNSEGPATRARRRSRIAGPYCQVDPRSASH
jgi:hypothetical protein